MDWFAILLAVETLNAADEALHDGCLADGEREVSVDMEGANS
jgi:hypothetical protein